MTLEITTDENGYFIKTVPFDPPAPSGTTVHLSAMLLSPFATGVWAELDIEARDGGPSTQRRAFVLWHSDVVQLGSWRLDAGDDIVVIHGKTRPPRANAQLVLELDAEV